MKKLIAKTMLAILPFAGLGAFAQTTALHNEITIRPLQPGVIVKGGVMGADVVVDINGQKIAKKAIYITGKAAEAVVAGANQAIERTGVVARYGFDASKEMIVVTGDVAEDLIIKFSSESYKVAKASAKVAVNGTKAIVIETEQLTAVSMAYARMAMVSAATYAKQGFGAAMATVRYVEIETTETVKDVAMWTFRGLQKAIEISKDAVVDSAHTALTAAHASIVFVNDAGLFVYDHTKKVVVQLAGWTEQGLHFAKLGVELTLRVANAVETKTLQGIKFIFKHLPRIGISVEI
jgi:hypothetical protein